jgi:lipopolysaccharide/colanic/teichoic acid biosynthesis glycosyltransferase
MSVIGPRRRCATRSSATTSASADGWRSSPGSPAGRRSTAARALPWEDRIELDVWYVEHRSPRIDLKILARTPLALFSGTYKGETGGWSPSG